MSIGGLVIENKNLHQARQARIARISAASRETTPDTAGDAPGFARRSSDAATAVADRRGIAPAVRSASTAIVFDKRGLDRREVTDRRKSSISVKPSAEFVAQAVAREGMLLDLRPDPSETRQARETYKTTAADNSPASPDGVNLKV